MIIVDGLFVLAFVCIFGLGYCAGGMDQARCEHRKRSHREVRAARRRMAGWQARESMGVSEQEYQMRVAGLV